MTRLLQSIALLASACSGSAPRTEAVPSSNATVAPSAPALQRLQTAPADAFALRVVLGRTGCRYGDAADLWEEELVIPAARAVVLEIHNIDDRDLSVSLGDTRERVAAGAQARLAFRVDHPGEYAWACPVEPTPGYSRSQAALQLHALEPDQDARRRADEIARLNPTTHEARVALGASLYQSKGCISCHSIDGTPRIGPSWKGIWGTSVTLADGTTRTVDAAYVDASVRTPTAFARPGYPPSMPAFDGMLRPIDIASLAAFIESLR